MSTEPLTTFVTPTRNVSNFRHDYNFFCVQWPMYIRLERCGSYECSYRKNPSILVFGFRTFVRASGSPVCSKADYNTKNQISQRCRCLITTGRYRGSRDYSFASYYESIRRPQGFSHRANVSVQARKYRTAFTCRGVGRRKSIAIIPPPTATIWQFSQWPFAGAVFTATSEQCASRSVVTSRQALAKLALIADGMMELAEPRQDRTSSIEKRYCFLGRQQLNYPHLW